MAGIEGGFPHSEIRGSKPVRGSPRLIAAYHVLHRLSAPRHPPDTLMSLDRSHHRCPSGSPSGKLRPAFRRANGTDARLHPKMEPQDLCFQTCPRRDAVKLPATCRPFGSGRTHGPSPAAPPTLGSDTFTLHDVEQHAPATPGRCAARRCRGRILLLRTELVGASSSGPAYRSRLARPPRPAPPRDAMVEQDGIEPTTSCLQSTRSPN